MTRRPGATTFPHRLRIPLDRASYDALGRAARAEDRKLGHQAAYLVKKALGQLGQDELHIDPTTPEPAA